jgi:hypothetical protein
MEDSMGEWVVTEPETGYKHYSVDVSKLASVVGERCTWGEDSIERSWAEPWCTVQVLKVKIMATETDH